MSSELTHDLHGRLGHRRMIKARAPLSVGFVLAENFTLSAFSLFCDFLRLAADEGDRSRRISCSWTVMAARNRPVRASCGVSIERDSGFIDPRNFDYIVVVGGLLHSGQQLDADTMSYLSSAARQNVTLVGLCTGSFILCRGGLMQGRRTCVSWYHYQDFLSEFPDQEVIGDRMFFVDRDRITCSGGTGTADLASFLVEKHLGRALAQKARHVLLLDRVRTCDEAQPHPPTNEEDVSDDRIRRALLLMEQHAADPLTIGEIADKLSLSPRHLERLFKASVGVRPRTYYRLLRLRYADWLLGHTNLSITDIAIDAGFADCAHFSRKFKELHGYPPSEARTRSKERFSDADKKWLQSIQIGARAAAMRVFD